MLVLPLKSSQFHQKDFRKEHNYFAKLHILCSTSEIFFPRGLLEPTGNITQQYIESTLGLDGSNVQE